LNWSACIGKSSLTISAKPAGVGVASQPWILASEQSSQLTRIATESVPWPDERRNLNELAFESDRRE